MNNYYHILGVTSTATLDQIKKAYRKKAKLYHPDINKSIDANEQFIHINEAYEYLLNTTGNNTNKAKRAREQAKKRAAYQQQWEQQERQNARQRAQAHARMKYEAYLKSDVYRTTEAINTVVDFFVALLIVFFVIGLPILSYREHGAPAILFSAIIILPTSPIWFAFIVKTVSNFNIAGLFEKKQATFQSKITNLLILFFINLIVFFKVTLNTHIKLSWIIGFYALSICIGFFASNFTRSSYYKYLIRFIWSPGTLNLLFLLNYLFATNITSKTFWFSYDYNSSPLYTIIKLENNTYKEYTGLRLFFVREKLSGKSCVTYNTGNGLFGIKVSKDIDLHSDYQQN